MGNSTSGPSLPPVWVTEGDAPARTAIEELSDVQLPGGAGQSVRVVPKLCVAEMRVHPEAILVTDRFRHVDDYVGISTNVSPENTAGVRLPVLPLRLTAYHGVPVSAATTLPGHSEHSTLRLLTTHFPVGNQLPTGVDEVAALILPLALDQVCVFSLLHQALHRRRLTPCIFHHLPAADAAQPVRAAARVAAPGRRRRLSAAPWPQPGAFDTSRTGIVGAK